VRIIKRKRKSGIQNSLLFILGSARALRRTYERLHAENHINNEAAILVRAGEKLAAENKILRKKTENLRNAIFEEKCKRKRSKSLNFYKKDKQKDQILFFNPAKVLRARECAAAQKNILTPTKTYCGR
jgi:hypothetical protein